MGIGTAELFDYYRQRTGLRNNDFDVPLVAAAQVLVDLRSVRIGVSADYMMARSIERGSPPGQPQRTLEESMSLQMTPILATVEWEPWRGQFRSYLSGGVGIALARFQWYETLAEAGQVVYRTPSNQTRSVPAVRAALGTHLLFDSSEQTSFRGALALELRYTYSPVSIDMVDGDGSERVVVGGSALSIVLSTRFHIGQ